MKNFTGIKQLSSIEEDFTAFVEAKEKQVLNLIEGKKVLDIGCGIGTYTRRLSEKGFEVVGVDSSTDCLSKARASCKAYFMKDDICNPKKLGKYRNNFDSIILFDVIEHIKDERKAFSNLRMLLRKNGVLIISVPAFQFLFSKHDLRIGHYRRYTIDELKNKLESSCFRLELIYYWNFPGFFAWLFFCKFLGKDPTKTSGFWVNLFYTFWFKIEERIHFPVGLTIIAKARKT